MTIKPAFTLIELLVVISIIGILLGIISVSFTTAQKQARDSRRRQDLVKIQNALEQYYTLNSSYPTDLTSAFQGAQLPTDPKNTADYTYNYNYHNSTSYCICAKLEQTSQGNANAPSSTTCNWNNQGDYLCVQNQQ